jgi:hypothetical protein
MYVAIESGRFSCRESHFSNKKPPTIQRKSIVYNTSSVGTKFLHSNELWDDLRRVYEVIRLVEKGLRNF